MKKIWIMCLLVTFILAGCSTITPTYQIEKGTISGKIIFPYFNEFFPNNSLNGQNKVVLCLDDEEYTITNYDGAFQFPNLAPGTHTLEVKNDAYFTSEKTEVNLNLSEVSIAIDTSYDFFTPTLNVFNLESPRLDVMYRSSCPDAVYVDVLIESILSEPVRFDFESGSPGLFEADLTKEITSPQESYTVQFTYLNQNEEELKNITKTIDIPKISLSNPEALAEGHYKIEWEFSNYPNEFIPSFRIAKQEDGWTNRLITTTNNSYIIGADVLDEGENTFYFTVVLYDKAGKIYGQFDLESFTITVP